MADIDVVLFGGGLLAQTILLLWRCLFEPVVVGPDSDTSASSSAELLVWRRHTKVSSCQPWRSHRPSQALFPYKPLLKVTEIQWPRIATVQFLSSEGLGLHWSVLWLCLVSVTERLDA